VEYRRHALGARHDFFAGARLTRNHNRQSSGGNSSHKFHYLDKDRAYANQRSSKVTSMMCLSVCTMLQIQNFPCAETKNNL